MSRLKSTAVWMAGVSALASTAWVNAEEALEEVVVTGSRVITNGDNSPTPVTVISYEGLQTIKPGPIADGLNLMPVFAGSRGQGANSNPSIAGGIGGGNNQGSQLNMRNLGINRNLVLFDGLRIPPTTFAGVVDTDMVPQNLIQRVDVVSGGVSAVYGSEAVTGVVNFVIDRKFAGVKAHMQYGASDRGDGDTLNASLAFGTDLFGGRGHFIGSYEYRDDKGIDRKSARPWQNGASAGGAGTAASPYYLVTGAVNPTSTFGGRFVVGTGANAVPYSFAANGVAATQQVLGTATGNNNVLIGGDGIFSDVNLKSALQSHQLFGRMDFDFTDTVHGNVMASANLKSNEAWESFVTLNTGQTLMSTSNPFYTATGTTVVTTPTFRLAKTFYDYDARYNPEPDSTQLFFAAGLDGKLGDYNWNVALWRGDNTLETKSKNNINNEKLAAALDATTVNGQIVCASVAIRPDCVPLNPFGPSAYNKAALDYILDDTNWKAKTVMNAASGAIRGAPFNTWVGPLNMALSGEWRKLSYHSSSEHPPELYANCTGITRNCTSTGATPTVLYNVTLPNRSAVSQTVKEYAFEFDAPLVKDVALVQSLNLNGAIRQTSYDTSGDYKSWKVGLDWHVNDQLRFRATRSRDIRAPNLFDTTAAFNVNQNNIRDPLTGLTTGQVPGPNIPNPDLRAEIGETTTAGVVWKPDFAPGLSVALDWYYIEINDAINTVQGFNASVLQLCADAIRAGGNGSNFFCSLQSRDPGLARGAGVYAVNGPAPTAFYTTQANLGSILTKGADLEVNYQTRLAGHPARARLLTSYQPHLIYTILPGSAPVDAAGFISGPVAASLPTPVWRHSVILGYDPVERLSVDVMYRWRSSLGMSSNPNVIWAYTVPAHDTTNLNLMYRLAAASEASQAQVFLNISNVFDQAPELMPGTTTPGGFNGWAQSDDWIGRYITLGVRYQFK